MDFWIQPESSCYFCLFWYLTIKLLKNIFSDWSSFLSLYIDTKDFIGVIIDPDSWLKEYPNKPNLCIKKKPNARVWLPRDGHGPLWRTWAEKAMQRFPELPVIDRCHSYQEYSWYGLDISRLLPFSFPLFQFPSFYFLSFSLSSFCHMTHKRQ